MCLKRLETDDWLHSQSTTMSGAHLALLFEPNNSYYNSPFKYAIFWSPFDFVLKVFNMWLQARKTVSSW